MEKRLRDDVTAAATSDIGTGARPAAIIFTPDLPKTRSGKTMCRLLADIANDEDLGDLSALRNPTVVGEIESARDRTSPGSISLYTERANRSRAKNGPIGRLLPS